MPDTRDDVDMETALKFRLLIDESLRDKVSGEINRLSSLCLIAAQNETNNEATNAKRESVDSFIASMHG